jgi:hypothetical protein
LPRGLLRLKVLHAGVLEIRALVHARRAAGATDAGIREQAARLLKALGG